MPKIYHGGLNIVERPTIKKPNRSLDYGAGLYTTTSYNQAIEWVRRQMKEKNLNKGYVSVFDFDEDKAKAQIKTKYFYALPEEWVDFVKLNRMQRDFSHNYDIVYGPVANDNVYTQFTLYEGGIISKETLINELKTYKLVDQFLFHTERSLKYLKFIEAIEIHL